MEDGAARGEAGDLTEAANRLLVAAEPVDWSRVEPLARDLADLADLAAEQQRA